jgi:hypothetical protein
MKCLRKICEMEVFQRTQKYTFRSIQFMKCSNLLQSMTKQALNQQKLKLKLILLV